MPAEVTASTASAIAGSTSSAVPSGASSTYATPSVNRSCAAAAAASASRVFPTPPIPVNVTNRCSPSAAVTRARSASRPSRAVAGAGNAGGAAESPDPCPDRGAGGHCRDQGSPGIGVGTERVAQRSHRVRVGAGTDTAFEGADRVTAQPSTLGEVLLGEPGGFSQGPKAPGQRVVVGHRSPLPPPRAAHVRRLLQGRTMGSVAGTAERLAAHLVVPAAWPACAQPLLVPCPHDQVLTSLGPGSTDRSSTGQGPRSLRH